MGYVGQTMKQTRKKLKEARGGFLFVDEAYQLTEALAKGQSDFGGEAIDEMMRVMLVKPGPKAVSFIFAGYKDEMERFIEYNAGIRSRIKYYFHFEDFKPKEIVEILMLKIKSKGYTVGEKVGATDPKFTDAMTSLVEQQTDAEMLSKYNGRLTDNLLQWAKDELTHRLPVNAAAADLNHFRFADFIAAISKFRKPGRKIAPSRASGDEVMLLAQLLARWGCAQMRDRLNEHGVYTQTDLLTLREIDLRSNFDLAVGSRLLARMLALVRALQQWHIQPRCPVCGPTCQTCPLLTGNDTPLPDPTSIAEFLAHPRLGIAPGTQEHQRLLQLFAQHQVGPVELRHLSYEDLREIGLNPVGLRRRVVSAIDLEGYVEQCCLLREMQIIRGPRQVAGDPVCIASLQRELSEIPGSA